MDVVEVRVVSLRKQTAWILDPETFEPREATLVPVSAGRVMADVDSEGRLLLLGDSVYGGGWSGCRPGGAYPVAAVVVHATVCGTVVTAARVGGYAAALLQPPRGDPVLVAPPEMRPKDVVSRLLEAASRWERW